MLKKETATPIENRATDMMKMLMDTRKQVGTLEKGFLVDAPAVWGEIDSRLSVLERGLAILQDNQSTLMKQYLDQQKRLDEEKPDSAVTNVTDRLATLENASASQYDIIMDLAAGIAGLKSRMEDSEDSVGAFRLAIARIDSE